MPDIHLETEIDASVTDIWTVLADFESYAEWNPIVAEASGEARRNGRVRMRIEPTDSSARDWVMRITEFDEKRRLEWVGTLFAPFVFRGRHAFELQPLDAERSRLVNHETLGGILSRFVDLESLREDYEAVNEALKERVEAGPRVTASP